MSALSPRERERLMELLADEQFDQLTPEDRAELASLRLRAPGSVGDDASVSETMGSVIGALDAPGAREEMPAALRARLDSLGRAMVTGGRASVTFPGSGGGTVQRAAPARWMGLAAGLLIAASALVVAWMMVQNRQRSLNDARAQLAVLQERVESNEAVLASARTRVEELTAQVASAGEASQESQRLLAEAAQREVALAEQLAAATADLDDARLEIAMYETPVDPATLQANRRQLLDVAGTVRIAWSPFDLPDAPAEQREVQGDVVWNDELQEGYLRFVGLAVNDPALEQYQVWVIDERGMEQKVSGGVFNATAQGEVIVPIEPGIDVGRVKLFAVTVENPGGTWVPDLKRRVVVAPVGEG